MKLVIAPDSFKECLTAKQVCEAIATGWRQVFPDAEIVMIPMADGGEGTVQALVDATAGRIVRQTVCDPLGEPVDAFFGMLGDGVTAAIEMAAASGLELVPADKRNPMIASTFGTGQLIRAALDAGARKLIVGIGGSATNDGGAGAATALGARLLDAAGKPIPLGGCGLSELATIDIARLDGRLGEIEMDVACDVTNPLTGALGASSIFGPQKGATPEMVEQLDVNLTHYAAVIRQQLGKEIEIIPGSGAAGGLGGGLLAFCNAKLKRGAEIVLAAVRFDDRIAGADLVITGEGRTDGQSIHGKTPIAVAKAAIRQGIPVIALVGALGPGYEEVHNHGINAIFSIAPGPSTLTDAFKQARINLSGLARNLAAFRWQSA